MSFLKNNWNKTTTVMMIGILSLIINCAFITISGNENSAVVNVSIDVFLQNDNIVVSVKPETKVNQGNTMVKTQIWGDYGRGWFLIKDYKSNTEKQRFVWNLKSLDNKNESYHRVSDSGDMFKIYVRYKKNFSSEDNKDNTVELYKTFYLGSPMQDVQLTTNQEKEEFAPVSYDFPVVVCQGSNVELYLNAAGDLETYKVKIVGDNYTKQVKEKADIINSKNEQRVFEWTPEESGTFNIAVYDSKSEIVLKRKVYVKSKNEEYLQLEDLSISNVNNVVYVRLEVKDTNPSGFDNSKINESLKFTISEPYVWTKTIKDYGDGVAYNSEYKAYEINEDQDGFELGSGTYSITSYIKTPHSIEPDDVIRKSYRQSGADIVDFKVNWSCANGKPDKDGSYSLKHKEPLLFNFQVKEHKEQYEYAFFLQDARGKRLVKNYSQSTNFSWSPADSGEYIVFARIRQKQKVGTLPNSYEKEVSIPIRILNTNMSINIQKVMLNGNEWIIDNGQAAISVEGKIIQSHTLNVIEVEAIKKGGGNKEAGNLMYKVYAEGKGYIYPLTPYTFSNIIPIYLKSSGEYRLIIMVKDSLSGSQEDQCEILINVK